ncbi:MAG: cob(I)yrinic acid a,c-diamide adenosyltransferase [Betaproteobacteria bacterium]
MQKSEDGLVIVYTGPGKGKTTAALGLVLRSVGHGRRVCLVQFLKGQATGEVMAAPFLPGFEVIQTGRPEFVDLRAPSEEDRAAAREGLRRAAEALRNGEYRLVILDEVNVAAAAGLVGVEEILRLLRERAPGVDVVLTGRGAPAEFIEAADLATEMREIKHPYRSGAPARAGIEY